MEKVNEIQTSLESLLKYVMQVIDKGKDNGTLTAEEEEFMKWELTNFRHTDEGIKTGRPHTKKFKKNNWAQSIQLTENQIHKLNSFKELQNKIKQSSELEKFNLIHFVDEIIRNYFYEDIRKKDITKIIESYLNFCLGHPVEVSAKIQLLGLTVKPDSIKINDETILRKSKREDFEYEFQSYMWLSHSEIEGIYPTAIIEKGFMVKDTSEILAKIEDVLGILRLFKVGAIRWKEFTAPSRIFNPDFNWSMSSKDTHIPITVYHIDSSDSDRLIKFWKKMENNIIRVTKIFEKSPTVERIAYQRYCDSLEMRGPIERRVAECIMGLEGIYLRDDGEQQELSYRLRLRVAKIMGIFGFDPLVVKNMINESYGIRSGFVHGGTLSEKSARGIKTKFGGTEILLKNILEFLRISIVLILLMRCSKSELIKLIDDAFLDNAVETELNNLLNPISSNVWTDKTAQ